MRWRRYINLVAVIGMLMHAGMVVRHHQVMLGAHLERQDLIGALGVICHSNGQATTVSDADVPWVPLPSDQQHAQCPLCAGLASAVALAASAECSVPVRFRTAAPPLMRYEPRPVEIASVRPPSRAPPHLI